MLTTGINWAAKWGVDWWLGEDETEIASDRRPANNVRPATVPQVTVPELAPIEVGFSGDIADTISGIASDVGSTAQGVGQNLATGALINQIPFVSYTGDGVEVSTTGKVIGAAVLGFVAWRLLK